jgi:3',5'-cyclic AMP phosphodiesterase CpdA
MPANRYYIKACLIITSIVLICLYGCGTISKEYPSGDFHLLVISDTHISSDNTKINRLKELASRINQGIIPGITMVINTGDVVSSVYKKYTADHSDPQTSRLFQAVKVFDEFKMPFYWTMGNHDYKIDSDRDSDAPFEKKEILMMESIWKELTGFDPYDAVFYRGWKFIFLNSMRGRDVQRNFDDEQLSWLENELEEQIPAVLFYHHPLETDNFRLWRFSSGQITPETEAEFYTILTRHQDRIKGIFVGHGHRFITDTLLEKIPVYETASFGDDDSGPYLIVGMDNSAKRINVGKGQLF